jgi:hypothetical protein
VRRKPRVRATVYYSGSRGHGKKLWAYSYEEIAEAAGTTVGAVRQAASLGQYDPSDLGSVSRWIEHRNPSGE